MNYADRYELFLKRVLEAHCSGLRKAIRRFLAEPAAGRQTDRERFRSIIARGVCKAALRTAPIGFAPRRILKCALSAFPDQEDALEDFIGDMWGLELVVEILGSAYKKRLRPPPPNLTRDQMLGRNLNLVLMLWDGFDLCRARKQKDAAFFHYLRSLPPLSRWNHKAAWKFIKTMNGTPGLSYETYRKGVSRLGLRQLKPILVQNMRVEQETRAWPFAIIYTPLGMLWLRESDSLGTVTQNVQKMSHDNVTPKLLNAANGSGNIAKRARGIKCGSAA